MEKLTKNGEIAEEVLERRTNQYPGGYLPKDVLTTFYSIKTCVGA